MADRELRFEQKMSDTEAMMWNIEHDPRLSSSFGSVVICDRPLDAEHLRAKVTDAVAAIPRLRERVAPILGRLAPPVWLPDTEFELDYHFRHTSLPAPGDDRQLFDLATTLLQEPFDRTRPLWLFVVVDGLSGGRGALFTKLHHTVADGEGAIRLSERYMDLERDAPAPPPVDLDELLAKARREQGVDAGEGFLPSILRTSGHTWRRAIGVARRSLGEVALVAADPERLAEAASNLRKGVISAQSQLSTEEKPGSPLWTERSRHRFFAPLDVDFERARAAAKSLGGTLNDFFVTGVTMATVAYHQTKGAPADHLNASFVVSTRDDRSAGGNAFTPSKIRVTGEQMDAADRFAQIRDAMVARKGEVTGGANLMGAVAGVANLLPTSVLIGIARAQAGSIDFATSNVRGAPVAIYVAGAKVLALYPMGPVANTAVNVTMMSYAGTLNIGVHLDPAAVGDPPLLLRCLREAYDELMTVAGVPARTGPSEPLTPAATSRKPASDRPPARTSTGGPARGGPNA